MGTNTPDVALHVLNGGANATDGQILSENVSGTTAQRVLFRGLNANGDASFQLENAAAGQRWNVSARDTIGFEISKGGTGVSELTLDALGNLVVQGTVAANNGANTLPDYVFEDDYELMPLADLAAFIDENGHLPNVPSAEEVEAAGSINMTKMQYTLLEKVEELTLYTLAQQELLEEQAAVIEELKKQLNKK